MLGASERGMHRTTWESGCPVRVWRLSGKRMRRARWESRRSARIGRLSGRRMHRTTWESRRSARAGTVMSSPNLLFWPDFGSCDLVSPPNMRGTYPAPYLGTPIPGKSPQKSAFARIAAGRGRRGEIPTVKNRPYLHLGTPNRRTTRDFPPKSRVGTGPTCPRGPRNPHTPHPTPVDGGFQRGLR